MDSIGVLSYDVEFNYLPYHSLGKVNVQNKDAEVAIWKNLHIVKEVEPFDENN